MPSITINTYDESVFARTEATNGFTVYVPLVVKQIPTGESDVYKRVTTLSQLESSYYTANTAPTDATQLISYNYAKGLLAKGYALLVKPLTKAKTDESAGGTAVTTATDAISALATDTTQMAITDKFLYDVDFLTDGGLCAGVPSDTASLSANYVKVYTNLNTVATSRADCMVVVGLYNGCAQDKANSALGTTTSEFMTAPYGPSIKVPIMGVPTKMDGAFVFLSTLAESLRSRNVWYPPAGVSRMTIRNASDPDYEISGATLDAWQNNVPSGKHPVNPIMNIRNYGYTIFGQRTMKYGDPQSSFRNINTTLVTNVIKKTIFNVGIGLMFDQNEVNTWTLFKTRLGNTLEAIQADRGITDYRIIMDETTTTPDDLAANRLRGKVYISVVNIVEDIVVDFYIEPQAVTFED